MLSNIWRETFSGFEKSNFVPEFKKFVENNSLKSENFKYWSFFLDELYPILRDLTQSFRKGDWGLHTSAIVRSLPLFFAFDRPNYSRWAPIYYEDCLELESKLPELYNHFVDGGFVACQSKRCGSSLPQDQFLEKAYNRPAKVAGGIIGMTRRKENVAKWELNKHEKDKYIDFLTIQTKTSDENEFSVHYEFSPSVTSSDFSCVGLLITWITEHNQNPFNPSSPCLQHRSIFTGCIISHELTSYLLDSISKGKLLYKSYVEERLLETDKQLPLQTKISQSFSKVMKSINKSDQPIKSQEESNRFLRTVEVAFERGYSLQLLLCSEITKIPLYLFSGDGLFKKTQKADLGKMLKSYSKENECIVERNEVVIFDFMAQARKVPIKKLNFITFKDLASYLCQVMSNLSRNCKRVDVVFDCYSADGIKNAERFRRTSGKKCLTCIFKPSEKLPNDINMLWQSTENKIGFQQFFTNWMLSNFNDTRQFYFGGCHLTDAKKCVLLVNGKYCDVPDLLTLSDEADDRIMLHVSHCALAGFKTVTVVSPDTDVLVMLLHHFYTRWRTHSLQLWFMSKTGSFHSVNKIMESIPGPVLPVLLAFHSLTGCDTVSKVGSKAVLLKLTECFSLIANFGKNTLSPDIIGDAEHFLVCCVLKKFSYDVKTFDDLRLLVYYKNTKKLEISKLPCTSDAIVNHIKRAHLQCWLWESSAAQNNSVLDPLDYGYLKDNENVFYPMYTTNPALPSNFPSPCSCLKCMRETICTCRVAQIPCIKFCKCNCRCRNPY